MHRTLNPVWESKWRVAGLPRSGFKLTIRLRDEDPGDHDDRLGTVLVRENCLHENLFRDHQEYNVKKTRGSVRSYILTYVASAVSKHISVHARLYLSIKVIGKTLNQADRRVYTVGPRRCCRNSLFPPPHLPSGIAIYLNCPLRLVVSALLSANRETHRNQWTRCA